MDQSIFEYILFGSNELNTLRNVQINSETFECNQ